MVIDNSKPARSLAGKKVLVTGGSGFLGTHLCRALCSHHAEVHAVSRRQRSSNHTLLRWWQADILDVSLVRQIVKAVEPDWIFHLTSLGIGAPNLEHLLPTLHNDLVSTVNMLTLATESHAERIILAASLEEPQPGSTQIVPSTPYAAAKWAGSGYAQMCHLLYKTPVVLVRPYMTYGPGQLNHKLLPHVILSLLKGEAPKLSSGNRPVDWVFVDDVTEGFLLAAQAPEIFGETIDLGSGTLVTIRETVESIVQLSNSPIKPLYGALPDRPQEKVRVADTDYALAKLGWRAVTSLESGLKQTIEWYRQKLATSEETQKALF